jgi:hypothetical protein
VEGDAIALMVEEKCYFFVMLSGGRAVACDRSSVVEAPLLSADSVIHGYQSLLKSSHFGFIDSIRTTFCDRRHPFSCFSRPIAL